jgi:dihydrofolate synthase/folylpolyglutamate synthase
MTYDETLKYLEELVPREFRMQLDPMVEACHLLGQPQKSFPVVHITGTNGKGSTAAFLAEILKESGYRVGLSTSPHLTDVRERIRVEGEVISEADFIRIAEEIKRGLPDERFLSYFEFITLLGFMYFRECKVDVAVIETGLGGRLDATNVVEPKVAVITSISIDHQHHLGNTLKEITSEKCGIVKRSVPTVTAVQPDEAMTELRRWCDDVGSPLFVADPHGITGDLGLKGEHQKQNAACAVEAAHLLSDIGFKIGDVKKALARTEWAGRLETLQSDPTVVIDGAHNLAGAEMLARYIRTEIPKDNAVLMLGVLDGKDVAGMCRTLVPLFREVICVRAPSERSASPKDVAATARAFGSDVHVAEDVETALGEYMPKLKAGDTLVVSGSLTTIGAVRGILKKAD